MNKSNFITKILMIILLIEGCKNINQEASNFRKYREIKNDSVFYTMPVFTQSVSDSIYTLYYIDSSHQVMYYFSSKKGFNNRVVHNQSDTQKLFFAGRKNYTLGKEDFTIYKFIENKGVTDGEISLFWSPSYGIILERTNAWRNIRKLIATKRKEQNDTIAILCDFIFSDVDFYRNRAPNSTIKFVTPTVEKDLLKKK